jgi:hypothetical protein
MDMGMDMSVSIGWEGRAHLIGRSQGAIGSGVDLPL